MTDNEIIQKTNEALLEEFELEKEDVSPDDKLYEDLGMDSLDAVDMVVLFEKLFGIKIGKDPAILKIQTLGQLHEYIIAKVRGKC